MEIIHGTEQNFNELINDEVVLVDFYANWCGPCKMLSPVLEELASDRASVKIVKMDVDNCEALARSYGIMSVPTLLLFKKGQLVSQKSGFMPKDMILEWIES